MRKALLLIGIIFLTTQILTAQMKMEKFMVKGSCDMCGTRIENAAMSVEGVVNAQWCKKSQALKFKYDASKTDKDKVQKAVAKVGHDTEKYKADDKVYKKLPACCKYRESKMSKKSKMDKKNSKNKKPMKK